MVWRCLGGGAGEEDEVIFGLKDLREMKLVKPRLNVSNSSVRLLHSTSLLRGNYSMHCWLGADKPFFFWLFVFHEKLSGNLFEREF